MLKHVYFLMQSYCKNQLRDVDLVLKHNAKPV